MLEPEEVLKQYNGTILKVANKFNIANSRFDFEDLVEEGRVAAIAAAASFDPNKGVKFITYLTNALKRELSKFVGNNSYEFNVPEYYRRKEYEKHGSLEHLQVPSISLNEGATTSQVGESDSDSLYSVIASGDMNPEEALLKEERIQILREEMQRLPEKEREVLRMRYFENWTLAQVAERMHVTKQTIHGWQTQGFNRLQRRILARFGHDRSW